MRVLLSIALFLAGAEQQVAILPKQQSTQVVILGSLLSDGDVQKGGNKCPTASDAVPVAVWVHQNGWRQCNISTSRFEELCDGRFV